MFSWLTKLLRPGPLPQARDKLAFADELHWIAAKDNPWGVDILDCRPVTLCWHSATSVPAVADSFSKLRLSDGRQHLSAAPLPHAVESPLVLDISVPAPEGTLYRASQMEEKWDVYHLDGRLFVARSWTGDVLYTARLTCDGVTTRVEDIRSFKPDDGYARKELHFLLWSHTQAQLLPAPLPVHDMPDPENRGEKALAGNHMFSTFGRFGWFATIADMTDKPLVDKAVLKPWLEAHPMQKRS